MSGNLVHTVLPFIVSVWFRTDNLSKWVSQSYKKIPLTASTHAAQTFEQTHKQTKNIIGDHRETFTKRRKLNKQNSRNVNKNRMRERARHNKHTHTHIGWDQYWRERWAENIYQEIFFWLDNFWFYVLSILRKSEVLYCINFPYCAFLSWLTCCFSTASLVWVSHRYYTTAT